MPDRPARARKTSVAARMTPAGWPVASSMATEAWKRASRNRCPLSVTLATLPAVMSVEKPMAVPPGLSLTRKVVEPKLVSTTQ